MLVRIRYKEVKVRRTNSHLFKGDDKFTGTVTYSAIGTVDGQFVRMSLGTEEKNAAIRRIKKLEAGCAEGPTSHLWAELEESLPRKTFQFFADRIGYLRLNTATPITLPTWKNISEVFEIEMERKIQRKLRGDTKQAMAHETRERYRQVMRHFAAFLANPNTRLDTINESTIEMYKAFRQRIIGEMKQARGGSSIALDIAILHGIFRFAVEKKLMVRKPIELKNESKPGANPKNGARSFTADELTKLRTAASVVPKTDLQKKLHNSTGGDLFVFLVLRWTGLRRSDAMKLRWQDVHFDRGENGEIEVVTQKRGKIAIIPLSPELRDALDEQHSARNCQPTDAVLLNPESGKPFSNRARLYEHCLAMGRRSGVRRATPHCYRDTFACDMLARGVGIYQVAMMLADTVDTIQKHYAEFIPAARDAVQAQMANGIGIEERGRLLKERGKKVVGIRG